MIRLAEFLQRLGFQLITSPTPEAVSVSYQKALVDVHIREAHNVVGFVERRGQRLDTALGTRLALQVMVTINGTTRMPVFAPLPDEFTDAYLLRSVFLTLQNLLKDTYPLTLPESDRTILDQSPEPRRLSSPQ